MLRDSGDDAAWDYDALSNSEQFIEALSSGT
ncbi:hypothetical protein U2A404240001 [Corynebacterium striatum]|nr:hypothetical protein U2A404240001 [Corynebacterium striatum]